MKRSGKLPIFTIIAGGLLLLIGVVLIWKVSISSANRRRLDAIAAGGEPVTLAALDKFYKSVSNESNAALVWLDGMAALTPDLVAIAGNTTLKRGVRLNDEQLESARTSLAANEKALVLFRRAAALSHSRYPIALNQVPFTNWHHLGELKTVAQVLRIEAAVALESENPERAARAINRIFAAASSLASEPILISQLVRYAIDAIGVQTLQVAVNSTAFVEADLLTLQTSLSKSDDRESLSKSLAGERAFFISTLNDPSGLASAGPFRPTGLETTVGEVFVQPLTRITGFWQRDLRFGIDALTTNIAEARLPDPQRFHSRTNADEIAARARSGYYFLSAALLPGLQKVVIRDATHSANTRTAFVGLALERFRLANNGKLPDQLTELVPAYLDKVPIDPFDGQPVRFKPTERGYVVYCVGVDEKDDGGTEKTPKAPKGAPEDITFIVERP